jgi:hypothetical protein
MYRIITPSGGRGVLKRDNVVLCIIDSQEEKKIIEKCTPFV